MQESMNHIQSADLTLAILAGGKGMRMGGLPKPLMRLEGRTFMERLLDLRSRVGDTLVVANAPSAYERLGVRVVGDLLRDRGAPGGLHAALHAARTSWVLLVAGDMPRVLPQAIDLLVRHVVPGVEWVCFEREDRLQPMPGLYARTLIPLFDERLKTEAPSFRALLQGVEGVRVPVSALQECDPELHSLEGVNTPEEARRIGAIPPVDAVDSDC
jgi:molybdopterin-guanine dinucleotide biosynthesis protein A